MSKRMSDERLAEIDSPEIAGRRVMTDPVFAELLQALKAEREHSSDLNEVIADKKRLTRELDVACFGEDAAEQASLCDLVKVIPQQIAELEGQFIASRESHLAVNKQLAAVRALPDKWDHEDTGYYAEMRQCAAELREALAGEQE